MNLSILEQYIEEGKSHDIDLLLIGNPELLQETTSHGISPLLLACYYNKPQIIRILLQHTKTMTIHEACAAGLTSYVEAIIQQAPSVVNEWSAHGFSPLAMATYFNKTDIVRLLLSKKVNPNIASRNEQQAYPLHIAAANNHEEIGKMLLEADADVNAVQSTGETALHFAAQHGNIDLIVALLEFGADTRIVNIKGLTPADLAAEKGFKEIAEILAN
ncbi:ankyrin repeat domain-containing protein [Sphingobacterium thalpophilum]|uniref:Ankyrin repeat domain-containing protein n=1 Tax=Sphingobacterium thalpophilum TaxID=259 RepID=A0A4U9W693_9SPHI|nr:ankyrin repeat domain-containing protein [Sphingobacterium thalpophilum]VTR54279.1 Ribulose-5-phosphate 4-epimerase and related epimerases and aldolases [Sphingobacterium thalpophilum]